MLWRLIFFPIAVLGSAGAVMDLPVDEPTKLLMVSFAAALCGMLIGIDWATSVYNAKTSKE